MIDRLIELSAGHRLVVLILAAAAAAAGWRAMRALPLDALPDTGDRQVIVRSTWDRSPDLVDAQVTYPIVTALVGLPHVRSVRGVSDYGGSFVYVVLDDGADVPAARARTLEALQAALPRLPEGARTELGPDASALGWVFQYALVDPTGTHDLAALRSFQDWYLDAYLESVPGVAEVATVGGLVRQYQVQVDPDRLRARGLSVRDVVHALEEGSRDAGGRVIDSGGAELIVRGLARPRSIDDLAATLVAVGGAGAPVRVADVARVTIGSEFRRGIAELDGKGETVSGIVVMRQGENALDVIDRVKARLESIRPSLPAGVEVVPVYDRSELIRRAVSNLTWTIAEVMAIVALVIVLFLRHLPSVVVPLVTLPVAVLATFIPFRLLGVDANIMSLAGIAIAVGALVDAAIVVVEQSHKRLEEWEADGRPGAASGVVLGAIRQVGRTSFFALLVIAVSFLPVATLTGEAGRLFRPLAYAKSLAMLVAAVLAVTLDPALRLLFTRVGKGTIRREEDHPVVRPLMRLYEPVVRWSLAHGRALAAIVVVLVALAVPAWRALGTEFMPPLDEGSILYMPTTMPGISEEEAAKLLALTDGILAGFPEVERVLGKAGRADSATDPAPLSMLETVVVLKPRSAWRPGVTRERLVAEMDAALSLPGVANAWTMPVRGRIDMLATGVRTPVGIRISGGDLEAIERAGKEVAAALAKVPGTRGVFAERAGRTPFLDIAWDRAALARAGIPLDRAQDAVRYAIGGETVAYTLEGRERYGVSVRYPLDRRADPDAIAGLLVSSEDGARQAPIGALATVRTTAAPAMLRNEDGLATAYVYVDLATSDVVGYVERARPLLAARVTLPAGCALSWTGQYEAAAQVKRQLSAIVPLTLAIIVGLLYVSTRSIPKTLIVLLAVPFSAIGAVLLLWILGYHVSAAVWVGLIALLGVDAETGVFMLLYLDDAHDRARREGRLVDEAGLTRAVIEGASRRLRPKLMTAATMILGLLPILVSTGTGSDVMKRIAAPLVGGIVTSFLLELVVYPAVYHAWRSRQLPSARPAR